MHVNKTKKIAILGVFAALSTVFTVLGTVISVNTVFFTALAAYLLGIIVVRFGIKEGILFYFVCAALDFFVNPNKMHVILYLALAAYNAGPGNVKKWLEDPAYSENGRLTAIPFSETEAYVKRVNAASEKYRELYEEELAQ